jgi:hypothetical protein
MGEMLVALMTRNNKMGMALRAGPPFTYTDKNGEKVTAVPWTGEETDWFPLPFDFSVAIAKMLIERKVTREFDREFNEDGFEKMIKWLVDSEGIANSISY